MYIIYIDIKGMMSFFQPQSMRNKEKPYISTANTHTQAKTKQSKRNS